MTPPEPAAPVGAAPAFRRALARVRRAAGTDVPLLLSGDSGVGKEVVARWVHEIGPRRRGPFLAVNAAALPEHLLESELFGHERGAFTGADRTRRGLFQEAGGGTLLIDEIGDLSLPLQAKLLRVLQEREVRPVGGSRAVAVDARVVTATHRDLATLVQAGDFRADLFYRVSVFVVALPPLRERPGDVELLAGHLLARHAGPLAPELAPCAVAALRAHGWPGNVRELENACRHALVLLRPGEPLRAEHLPISVLRRDAPRAPALTLRAVRAAAERERLQAALEATEGNRTLAARRLGVSRQLLHDRLRRFGIGPGAGRPMHVAPDAEWPEAQGD
jgi:two-component system NtrC family response regulator